MGNAKIATTTIKIIYNNPFKMNPRIPNRILIKKYATIIAISNDITLLRVPFSAILSFHN